MSKTTLNENQNSKRLNVLVVDDEAPIREVLSASLQDEGFEVQVAVNGEDGLRKLDEYSPQVVLLDIWMPGKVDGLEVLQLAKAKYPETEFIIMSGHGTIETAVKATKFGAWDFVEKPLSIDKILILIHNISTYQSERKEKNALLTRLRHNIAIVGDSSAMIDLKAKISKVAVSSSCVLISGENGVGKELTAQNIHYLSPRASQPFVEMNCSAVPEDLIEIELFGAEKGAFPGVDKVKKGKLDLASGGTLFLDEVGEMSIKAQLKILQVLQEQKFQRVGGVGLIETDVRLIVATSKSLEKEMAHGTFREDLYHRLNMVSFNVPAVRDRTGDIPALITHFSEQFARQGGFRRKFFSERATELMKGYSWPGNVRELRNFVERVYILTPGDHVEAHDLKFAGLSLAEKEDSENEFTNFREARAKFEKEYLLKKISENKGNISKTAESIGLERSYLHRKIKSYGIDVDEI